MRRLLVCLVLVAAGCLDPADQPATERVQSAIGEPMNGFPSPAERLGLMAINRARSDPETVAGSASKSYPARPPVVWSLALNQSARFHSTNLETADVALMHESPCTLNTDVATSGCDGDPSCACASPVPSTCAKCAQVAATDNGCGTDPFVRIGYFTSGTGISASGEVAAAGYGDPMLVVDGWMDEAAGSDGHRMILTDQGVSSNTMGYGHAAGANCFSSFDTGDTGTLKNATIPKLPTAAVSPSSSTKGGTFTFYATWADPALGAPSAINAVVDGSCTPMTRELGTDTLNATYKATTALAAGCHTYWISATDAAGAALAYPTTGSLTITVGGTACSADYMTAATGSCNGSSAGTAGTSGGSPGTGGAAPGTGGSPGTGGEPATDTPDSGGGCSCDLSGAQPAWSVAALLLLALSLLARPQPRRIPRR